MRRNQLLQWHERLVWECRANMKRTLADENEAPRASLLFSGVRAMLLLSPASLSIVSKNLEARGGAVVSRTKTDVTHVVLDQAVSALPLSVVCKKMGITPEQWASINPPPLIVALRWINEAIQNGAPGEPHLFQVLTGSPEPKLTTQPTAVIHPIKKLKEDVKSRLVRKVVIMLRENEEFELVLARSEKIGWPGVLQLLSDHTPEEILKLAWQQKGEPPFLRDFVQHLPRVEQDDSDWGVYLRCMRHSAAHAVRRLQALEDGDEPEQQRRSSRFRKLRRSILFMQRACEASSLPLEATTVCRYYCGSTEWSFATRLAEHSAQSSYSYLGGHYAERCLESKYSSHRFFGREAIKAVVASAYGSTIYPIHEQKKQIGEALKVAEALVSTLVGTYYHQGGSNIAVCGHEVTHRGINVSRVNATR